MVTGGNVINKKELERMIGGNIQSYGQQDLQMLGVPAPMPAQHASHLSNVNQQLQLSTAQLSQVKELAGPTVMDGTQGVSRSSYPSKMIMDNNVQQMPTGGLSQTNPTQLQNIPQPMNQPNDIITNLSNQVQILQDQIKAMKQ